MDSVDPLYILYAFLCKIIYFSCGFDKQQTVFVEMSLYFMCNETDQKKNAKTVAENLIKSITI